MKFSIVIPLYNKAPYVRCAIDSALAQSAADLEVVVVDDGSSDGGAELVEAIADPRVRLVRQSNGGVSVARNTGVAKSRGEWVAFLDADDWYHPHHLATLAVAQRAHPEADVVACDYVVAPHADKNWPPRWRVADVPPEIELITDLPVRWTKGRSLFTSAVAVRRARLHSMQPCFPPGESYGEDLDLWFRLAEKTPIALAHAPTVAYRTGVKGSLATANATRPTPPWVDRMRVRIHSGTLTGTQRRSALWLIAQIELTQAREELAAGHRRAVLLRLWSGRRAVTGARWWMTLVMAVFVPGPMVSRWQSWRVRRTSPAVKVAARGNEP